MYQPYKVLVVDDDQQERDRICKLIEGICDVVAPRTRFELAEVLRTRKPQDWLLAFVDYAYEFWAPGESLANGAEVLQRLRPDKNDNEPEVVLLTKYAGDPRLRKLARDYGAQIARADVTPPEAFRVKVRNLVDRRRRDRMETP